MNGEHKRQTSDTPCMATYHPRRLRSRASFVQTVLPLQTTKQAARTNIWEDEWQRNDTRALEWLDRGITPTESLASGHDLGWTTWKSLNRLRVEQGRCKALMKVWNYTTEDTCSCGSVQTMSHLLECPPVQPRRPGRTYPISCGLCPILAERHLRLLRTRRRSHISTLDNCLVSEAVSHRLKSAETQSDFISPRRAAAALRAEEG
ncbi:hypothetical protein F7725_027271 [Dissostichus mawsoni]|uniref:Uncharacterized protein n=1 Tax=Dissostichus mawsoni TaxID=36200 RepID=A0A7J5XCY8_DISMA|nr:hypothetical protein F7725_027271 [Dissostichus mawsoni]